MAKINFSKLEEMLDSSTSFSLSEKQYEEVTGRKMPKNSSYLVRYSAVAKFAADRGLKIRIQEKTITFERDT